MAFTDQNLIEFFKQRMVEVYDLNTLDSYSVRTCNTLSMFYELKSMLKGWVVGNVKRGGTVALCLEECIKLLEKDEWLDCSFYNKDKLLKKLDTYMQEVSNIKDSKDKKEKDNIEAKYMLHLVTSCIAANDKAYLQKLIAKTGEVLLTPKTYGDDEFHDVFERLDRMLSLLGTELLRRGYSRSYLYYYFVALKNNVAGTPFNTAYSQLQSKLGTAYKHQDDVIIRLSFSGSNIPAMTNMTDEVPAEYLDAMDEAMKNYVKRAKGRRFYIVSVKATDTVSAMEEARVRLLQALDRNDMGKVEISYPVIITYMKNGSRSFYKQMNPDTNARRNAAKLSTLMHNVDESKAISKEIADRLNTALRHLRVGDGQTEIEQRFLNYWIGLEFIFATPRSGDSTFSRLKEKFPKMKTLFYLKRNVTDLDARLREKTLIGANDSFGDMEESAMDTAFNGTTDFLLKYRIKNMKSHLHNHNKVQGYLDDHVKNLEWHLSRIYHLRNELVHEAAIKQSIDGVASNLRSYLVFMLNLLLDYCNQQMQTPQEDAVVMDNFFWHYELLWLKLTPEYQKEGFLSLRMPEKLVK